MKHKDMTLNVVVEQRFDATPDGKFWDQTSFPYAFWQRYLQVFERVRVVARVQNVQILKKGAFRVDGSGVDVIPLPFYLGPGMLLKKFPAVYAAMNCALSPQSPLMLRIPSALAINAVPMLLTHPIPLGVEVVGDPYDVFAEGAIDHPLRPFFRVFFSRFTRFLCRRAEGVAYVSEHILKKRYSPAPGAFTTHYSSIDLADKAFLEPTPLNALPAAPELLFIGSLAQLYKGPDVLIEAVERCRAKGIHFHVTIVGGGKYRAELEKTVKSRQLDKNIIFTGQLPAGKSVRDQIDKADLFVLPARTEGLPRVIIESMARGKPCIATTVGGIPELLSEEDMVPPGDAALLADKLIEVVSRPDRMNRMALRNFRRAQDYRKDKLDRKRIAFYSHLRSIAEKRAGRRNGRNE